MLNIYPDSPGHTERMAWIDLFDPTPEEIRTAEQASSVQIPARAALEEIESSSRLRQEGDTLYLSMPVSAHSERNEPAPTPVGFVLNERVLVTIRYTELRGFDRAKEQLGRGAGQATPVAIFTALLECMVDFGADLLQQIAADLNSISRRVFRVQVLSSRANVAVQTRALRNTMIEVGQRGDKLSQIRDSLLGLQRISSFVAERGPGWIGKDVVTRLKTATVDVASLSEFEGHLSGKVQFLLDAVLGFINTEQNDIFKVLTIVSVVGVPPTLIAGIYGMNFQSMPEYHWAHGYAWGLSLIVLSTLLPVVWFKWRGWW
jgi:magnesium transporter